MDDYGRKFTGKLTVEVLATLPAHAGTSDEGRVVYALDTKLFSYGKDAAWATGTSGAAWLMRQMGVTPALIVFKGGIVLIVAAALWFAPSIYLTYGMVAICLFYCWVGWNNYKLVQGGLSNEQRLKVVIHNSRRCICGFNYRLASDYIGRGQVNFH